MVAISHDKINYHEVSKYVNVLIFKEFYPKTKNVSYYLNNYFGTWNLIIWNDVGHLVLLDICFNCPDLKTLFNSVAGDTILAFLSEVNLMNKI